MGLAAHGSFPQTKLTSGEDSSRQPDLLQVGRVDLAIFALVGLCAAITLFGAVPRVHGIDLLAVTAVLAGGFPVFREALENLLSRRMTMELSMSIALVGALAIREFSTALLILFFVLGAEILEGLTVLRGRTAIQNLLAFLPRKALVRRDGELRERGIADAGIAAGTPLAILGAIGRSAQGGRGC